MTPNPRELSFYLSPTWMSTFKYSTETQSTPTDPTDPQQCSPAADPSGSAFPIITSATLSIAASLAI